MERPVVYSAGLGSTFSMGSLAEGSEPISEVDEIAEVRSLHEKGNRALKVKNYSDAVKFFSDALEIDERNAALLQIRATVYIKMKNYAAAKKDTDILLQINSDNSQAHFLHGVALRHLKKNKDALAAFLIALDLDPEQADELTNHIAATAAGFCEITQELMESFKKMDAYKKMSEIGACLFSSKKYSLCIRILDTAQKFRTNQKGITMRVLLTLANAHSALKHDDQAIGLYQECLAIASSIHDHLYQTKALVNIASINQEIGDQQQAIVHYEKLLDLQAELREEAGDEGVLPEFWSPHLESALHLNLSVAYKMIGNMVDALKHAQEYVELLEKQDTTMQQKAESFYNIGMLNVILGNYETAIDNYQKFYEESKSKGDKKGISQAYGCLGSAYASLHNWKLALSYHEQDVAMSMKIGDCRMKSHAHEMMGDTLMMKGDHLAAVEAYEAMFKASKDKDTLLVSMALCKQGNAYKALGKHQYSLFFYEKALALAEASEFEPIRTTCMFKMAQVLLASTQVSDIEQALKYFEKLIPYFELKIQQHKDEASHCEASYYQQLKECYDGAQYALVKVGREKVALQYSEAYRNLSITELENYKSKSQKTPKTVSNMSSMEKLFSYVEQQNSLVLYYSLLPRQLLLWALAPSGEVRRFYCSKVFEEGYLHNQIYSLLSQLTKGHNARDIMTTCENRALPRKHGPLEDVQTENERKSSKKNTDSLKTGQDKDGPEMEDLCKNKDAARQLYNLLLGPIDDVLSGLKPGSPITIIPDKILSVCPFGSLKDWHGKYLYENFSLVYLPCILCVNIVTKNEQECLKCQDELEFRRSQSRYSSINKHQLETMLGNYSVMTTPENTSYETVNPKRIGNPGLLKSGRCPLLTTTTTPQGQVLQKLLRSPQSFPTELTYHSVSPTQGGERKTAGDQTRTQTKTVGGPSSLSRLLQYHSLSTLTAHTSTGTDITRSDQMVTRYQQISDQDRCLVIGNPNLPDRLQLNGRTWNVGDRLTFVRKEVDFVASYMDVDAITDTDATKERFLSEIGNATVIHIVSYACWEEGFLVMTPSDLSCLKGDIPEQKSYVVTTGDIVNTTMRAQLVVLSCGWSPYRKHLKQTDFKLAGAFLAAGCQCVLQTLWALPNNTMEVFLYHFYFALQSGCLLSGALSQAVLALRQDERFGDPFYWSAFVLIGKDVRVDLLNIRHAMLDQRLDHTEAAVQAETDVELLNPKLTSSQVSDKDELLQQQQKHLVRLLHDNHNQPDVIPSLIDLLDESLKRLHTSDNNNYVTRLTVAVGNSTGALDILHMLGFHFQGKEADVESPYVIYPHWNPHDLLVPCYDALKALSDLVKSADCVQALCDLLPLTQDVISHLIDLISITKHAPEIQLKVSDLSVRPLWVKSKVKALLLALGFHQIGMLLVFSNVPDNRRLLTATLQLLLSVSSQKSQVLLYRLDVSLLGKPPPTVNTMGGESWKLPSLGPVLLHKDQLRLSTPWMSVVESPNEMDTKMSLAKRKRVTEGRFSRQCDKARSWHQITVSAQANQSLDKIGRPKTSPAKVKVKPGSSASRPRVPVDLKPTLDIPATGQRRDYAHFILNERVEKVAKDGIAEVKRLYLPYVQASS